MFFEFSLHPATDNVGFLSIVLVVFRLFPHDIMKWFVPLNQSYDGSVLTHNGQLDPKPSSSLKIATSLIRVVLMHCGSVCRVDLR